MDGHNFKSAIFVSSSQSSKAQNMGLEKDVKGQRSFDLGGKSL